MYPYHLDSIEEQKLVELKDHPNYFISNFGYVLRREHWVNAKKSTKAREHSHKLSELILIKYIRPDGYWAVDIKGKSKLLHRLLAQHFIPNPENKKTVNHKDGNRWNLSLDNLEWATQAENNQHAYDTGLKIGAHTGRFGKLHHRSKPILKLDSLGMIVSQYESVSEAAKKNGLGKGTNLNRPLKKRYLFHNYYWVYAV